jgi:hypothetical protein
MSVAEVWWILWGIGIAFLFQIIYDIVSGPKDAIRRKALVGATLSTIFMAGLLYLGYVWQAYNSI